MGIQPLSNLNCFQQKEIEAVKKYFTRDLLQEARAYSNAKVVGKLPAKDIERRLDFAEKNFDLLNNIDDDPNNGFSFLATDDDAINYSLRSSSANDRLLHRDDGSEPIQIVDYVTKQYNETPLKNPNAGYDADEFKNSPLASIDAFENFNKKRSDPHHLELAPVADDFISLNEAIDGYVDVFYQLASYVRDIHNEGQWCYDSEKKNVSECETSEASSASQSLTLPQSEDWIPSYNEFASV